MKICDSTAKRGKSSRGDAEAQRIPEKNLRLSAFIGGSKGFLQWSQLLNPPDYQEEEPEGQRGRDRKNDVAKRATPFFAF